MTLRRARYSKIERLVSVLLDHNDEKSAPVHIERIVKYHGIEVRAGDLKEVSGLLVRSSGSAIIGVNSTQSRQRQRFTIAHEFGHFLLHEGLINHIDRDYRINFRSDESSLATNVDEIEANFFAASILMPKEFLDHENAVDALDSDRKVAELAKKYDVSRHAMSLRLVNLYSRHSPF
jgi:Zn-dependent peptidase ImmA (M78 family)